MDLRCVIHASTELAETATIQNALRAYNRNGTDPMVLESRWPTLTNESPVVKSLLDNPATPLIQNLITTYSLQGEGFLIGRNGGLVAMTNLTSDYFQGDEEQFTETIKLDRDQAWIQDAEVDQSASALLIKIAVPVFTSANAPASGVLVIGLDQFIVEFYQGCHILDAPQQQPHSPANTTSLRSPEPTDSIR
ncbi:hypothetical protein [Porticoccus sp.]